MSKKVRFKFKVDCRYYEMLYGHPAREMRITKRTKKKIHYYYIGYSEIIKAKIKVEGITECANNYKALQKVPTIRI